VTSPEPFSATADSLAHHEASCPQARAGGIAAASFGRVEARTTIEVVQESAWLAARRPRSDAVVRARSFAVILSRLLQPGDDDIEPDYRCSRRPPALGSFDAVLAGIAHRPP
jgi:hypothetical protein